MNSKIYSTIIISSILGFALIATGISTTTFVNVNAQGGGANQTIQQQQEDPEHSANRTMEKAIQSANETREDVDKVGSKITEGAKDLVGNIGEKLQDLGK